MNKLAIVGTGVAGLGCAHFLHPYFDLTLFEQNDYAGGHTNTIDVQELGRTIPIDTGFMVYNEVTYPNLTRLFRELQVATKPTSMSFSVQHLPSGLEYNGTSLNHLFGQRRNLLRPRFWRMLTQINRFNAEVLTALDRPETALQTVRQYVTEHGYGDDFLKLYLIPMSSAVWSTPPQLMLEFPATTLLRFFYNHGFLGLHTQHPWRTVTHGARTYAEKIKAPFRDKIRLNHRAVCVKRGADHVQVYTEDGSDERFDKIVLATHADQALALLAAPTEAENQCLAPFKYQTNIATLHTDAAVMPKTKRCWASWNYRLDATIQNAAAPSVHYWMNSLQNVSRRENYFVSLNCHERLAPSKVLRRIEYQHPLFNLAALEAQVELPTLNRLSPHQNTYFCGSYFKYGFHEDAFTSGLHCARDVAGRNFWS